MHNMIIPPTSGTNNSNPTVTGYGSSGATGVHQNHPESAFFKPKINTTSDRAPIPPNTTSHRANRLGTQRYPHQGTISPKAGT